MQNDWLNHVVIPDRWYKGSGQIMISTVCCREIPIHTQPSNTGGCIVVSYHLGELL
jgi:hypothetical protein